MFIVGNEAVHYLRKQCPPLESTPECLFNFISVSVHHPATQLIECIYLPHTVATSAKMFAKAETSANNVAPATAVEQPAVGRDQAPAADLPQARLHSRS